MELQNESFYTIENELYNYSSANVLIFGAKSSTVCKTDRECEVSLYRVWISPREFPLTTVTCCRLVHRTSPDFKDFSVTPPTCT